jgi:hypothetical protein
LRQGGRACVLDGVLGHLQVTHQAGDGGDRRPPVGAEQIVVRAAQEGALTCTTGRTSMDPSNAVGRVAAHFSASSRSAHSMRV